MELFAYLEQTGFSTWVRESRSLFAYPGVLLLHTCGMAVVVGLAAGIDLRILGFAPALPLAPMRRFLPLLWVAFAVNAATGTILLLADATTKLANPDFFVKMAFIFAAVIVRRAIDARVFRGPESEAVLVTSGREGARCRVARVLAGRDYRRPAARVRRAGQRAVVVRLYVASAFRRTVSAG